MDPYFISSRDEWHEWLQENHDTATEFVIGFYKTKSGIKGISYQDALDEALCFGWIYGVIKGIDEQRFSMRFTPRKKNSIWSVKNMKRIEELIRLGLMQPSGLKSYQAREEKRSGVYSFENETLQFSGIYLEAFLENKKAWAYFLTMPPSYRKTATHWVMRVKQEETRLRRLDQLISASENGERVGPLKRPGIDK